MKQQCKKPWMGEETFSKRAARAAYGWGRSQHWGDALELLGQAAAAGEQGAARQLELVRQAPFEELLNCPPIERLSTVSQIGAVRGFAPAGFSEWLISRAAEQLLPAVAYCAHAGAVSTASEFEFGAQQRDVVLAIMQERAARLTQVSVERHEPPNVISYEPGQEFRLHADFLDPNIVELHAELRHLGQRVATIVTYLNEDFEGAETYFPKAGVKFRGGTGDAIAFVNVGNDGKPDTNTHHAGLPPTSGRKWVLSQWIRSKPFPYTAEHLR